MWPLKHYQGFSLLLTFFTQKVDLCMKRIKNLPKNILTEPYYDWMKNVVSRVKQEIGKTYIIMFAQKSMKITIKEVSMTFFSKNS